MPDAANPIMVPAPEVPNTPAAPAAPVTPPAPSASGTPAAPAAPAAPVADASIEFTPPPPPAAPTPPQDNVVVYEKTGDASLDVALAYVGQRGFGPDHPAIQAATKGDFSALETALKGLGDKAKDAELYVTLAKDAYGRKQAAAKAATEATAKAVYDAVGGEARWAAIKTWAAENADAGEKDQLNAAFKAGGVAAKSAAQYLAALYDKHGKAAPKAAVKADATGQPPSNGALSPREYAKEVRTLSAKLGARMESSPEYQNLQARRRAFRA